MLGRWWERLRGRAAGADEEVAEHLRALASGQSTCPSPATTAWLAERGFEGGRPRPRDACRLPRNWRQQRLQNRAQRSAELRRAPQRWQPSLSL
eukprot:15467580-Alexandrium_andersonii.AAC.1